VDGERLRLERIADVEGMGRLANEEIARAALDWPPEAEGLVRCECGDDVCHEPLRVTHAAYDRVRADPMLFLVRPGHIVIGAEDVVERAEHYWVIRKHEDVRARVEASDPRSAH